MDGPEVDLDMDGYGCFPLWIGLDWMDIPTFEYIRVFQSTTFIEAAILENTPETCSKDSTLFREISRFMLSERPVLKDFAK